jgi:hypothetical protein
MFINARIAKDSKQSRSTKIVKGVAMSKKDLDRIKRQLKEEKQRFLVSLPKEKRLELERLAELDIPQFMRDREQRIMKAKRSGKV